MTAASTRQPGGMSRETHTPQTSLYANLAVTANRDPNKDAIFYYGESIRYARLQREVDALAGFLQGRCGVARGDRVVLYMHRIRKRQFDLCDLDLKDTTVPSVWNAVLSNR